MSGLLAQIEFEHPAWLLCLVVLPVIVYFAWRTGVTATRTRRWGSVICRTVIVVLLVVAFAGLIVRSRSEQRLVIFATDTSRSVGGPSRQAAEEFIRKALEGQGDHKVAFISFADQATTPDPERMVQTEKLDSEQSIPAEALRLATAWSPTDLVPQIVLLTDGNETQGELAKAALATNIPVTVKPLDAFPGPEVCVSELIAPKQGSQFADTPIEVVVLSNQEVGGDLELLRDGQSVDKQEVTLKTGENRFRFALPLGGGNDVVIQAKLETASDTIAENNQRRTMIFAARSTRILMVDAEPALAELLKEKLDDQGCDVTLVTPDQVVDAGSPFDAFDLAILSDVKPNDFPADTAATLDRYVKELGGGLIMLGGEDTFGEASYRDSPLERMMPVEAYEEVKAKKMVLAMVLVIDTSGSMEEEQRMVLAKQAAKQSIGLLEPHDKAGVMAFSDVATWVAELGPCTDKPELMQRIDTLTPLGQTNMYGAVERAFLALEQTDADRRHMILLTDGTPAPGDYCKIAAEMAEAGITLSTVSISPGAEQDLLKKMARIAGDERRHRHCDDPADVPKILIQETQAATDEAGLHDIRPFVLRTLPGLDVESAPALTGHVPTGLKPGAEPLLMAGSDPLLTWWRYGAGVSVAFTSDAKNRWGQRWQKWPGFAAFWKRLVRHAARKPQPSNVSLGIRRVGGRATVVLDIRDDQGNDDGVDVFVSVNESNVEAAQVAPGRYEARFDVDKLGQYMVEAVVQDASGGEHIEKQALFVDYLDELLLKPTNHTLLKSVAAATGGVYDPEDPASVFTPDGRTVERVCELWYWFVMVAMVLFVVDVGLRRLRF
ncbi:MAG: VWA domain-containing protein [Planctomycetes bacterium]|nr:VWA domain-containing protein [Planctomycetota bacterium]MBL7040955.1 VWA domain-containing protein [Pirellulaceae bacterium]